MLPVIFNNMETPKFEFLSEKATASILFLFALNFLYLTDLCFFFYSPQLCM